MAVIVHTPDDVDETIPNGTKWHIDDEQKLHVIDTNGKHVAAFATGQWAYIITDDEEQDAAQQAKRGLSVA